MQNHWRWIPLLLLPFFSVPVHAIAEGPGGTDSLAQAVAGCQAFQNKLKAYPNIQFGVAQLPKNWSSSTDKATLPVFWWKRAGKDPSYPPLAFLHGGPASNSWALLDAWKEVIENYPGDFIAFDHRGEGCSKTLSSNLDPDAYENYRVRSIVKDIEYLREHVFHYEKWRVMGHSRGAAMVHFYLEMAPESLESATAMGFSFLEGDLQKNYPRLRAMGFQRAARAYLQKYPNDADLTLKIRRMIDEAGLCWAGIDGYRLCGSGVLDVLAVTSLKFVSAYDSLHKTLVGMVDTASIRDAIETQLKKEPYGHFKYIAGTNTRDMGGPDSETTRVLKETNDPVFVEPFLAEIRYVANTIAPLFSTDWRGRIDHPNYQKIKSFLDRNPTFQYNLYAGDLDAIAPPELYQSERELLGNRVHFTLLKNVGHEGYFHPLVIANVMRKNQD